LIDIINKKTKSSKDLFIIQTYLSRSDLIVKLKKSLTEETSINKIVSALSNNISIKEYSKDKAIYKIGDQEDNFYFILKGKVKIFKPVFVEYTLSHREYLEKLYSIYIKKETFLLNKTIAENSSIYNIEINDIPKIKEIQFYIEYKKLYVAEKINMKAIIDLFRAYDRYPENEFDTDFDNIINSEKHDSMAYSLIESMVKNHFEELEERTLRAGVDFKKFKCFEVNESRKKQIFIYENQYIESLDTGKSFGEYALDKKGKVRNATIIVEEDYTYLAVIKLNVYKEYILVEKERLTHKEIQFLMDNFFFKNVKYKAFSSTYYFNFKFDEYQKDTILFKENEPVDCIYFIKEGEVELTINKNIIEIQKLINSFVMLDKNSLIKDYTSVNGMIVIYVI